MTIRETKNKWRGQVMKDIQKKIKGSRRPTVIEVLEDDELMWYIINLLSSSNGCK
jgi:hypothetical protein